MAGFGWPVGDLVASIQLVVKIAGALREAGGSKSDYQESARYLLVLEITLQNLQSIALTLVSQSQGNVQPEVERIVKPLSVFLVKIRRVSLSSESK